MLKYTLITCLFLVLLLNIGCIGAAASSTNCNESKAEFIVKLVEAISKKNWSYISLHSANDFQSSFGPESGLESFQRFWQPESNQSKIWEVLSNLVKLEYSESNLNGESIVVYPKKIINPAEYRLMLRCRSAKWEIFSIINGD